ncbi:MAG TPA: 5-methyltetrahydropteroyltriglutamate--homocysteine S-methyltransferase [Xanthobacteraceae bacterium]|nr:5-methyltetrahydropteroyltriglutamate--homocysteine S-methyltransferase [Xanthobacteraceae bacterium]
MSPIAHNPPFRAEQIGSFLRPPELLRAREDFAAKKISADALRSAENAAIKDFVALQQKLGFKAISVGEFRRSTYTANFTTEGLTGVTADHIGEDAWSYTDASGHKERARIPQVDGRIMWNNSTNARDFADLAAMTPTGMTPKITLPGPCYIHFRAGRARISQTVYPDLQMFWKDLIAAYEVELTKLYEAGCRYVQLDETSIAKLGDEKIRSALSARGDDWEALLSDYVDVINTIAKKAPKDMRIGLHLCRGNRMGHWQAEGGYDVVAEKLFRDCAVDFYFLEYDSERAGTFEPLRALPSNKSVVLGLISTKVAELETEEFLQSRIKDCARIVDLDRLAISPQCGFSSSEKGNTIMSYDRAVEKLARVVETAQRVWRQ